MAHFGHLTAILTLIIFLVTLFYPMGDISTDFRLQANVSTVRDSEKKFNYDEYKVDHVLSNEP